MKLAKKPHMKLSQETLSHLTVPTPSYDRSKLTAGIAHFGVGGFHRAHQAMYLDRLFELGLAHDWAICGVGVLPGDLRIRRALAEQDYLYTLVTAHTDGARQARVIGSMVDYRYAPEDPEGVIELLADPAIRIISLTITEGSYNIRDSDGEFNADNPDIQRDLAGTGPPRTVFGLVASAFERRRQRGLGSPAILSCDNIAGNGDTARRAFTAYAQLHDPSLAQWIRENTTFPSSMVDRITPATTPEAIRQIERDFHVSDLWPVVAEPFAQWVVEDDFAAGRPPLEAILPFGEATVQLVQDVAPYELMKLRLLNAGHQALCYFASLAGHRLVHEAARDPLCAGFVRRYLEEATPTLLPVPGVDLGQYKRDLMERFANPHIADTVARLAAEASDRIPKFVLPAARDNLRAGRPADLAAALVASWARYAEGTDEAGAPIDVADRLASELGDRAKAWREDPLAFLAFRDVFGDLVDEPRFTRPYLRTLERLHRDGARAALRALVPTADRLQAATP
ncbi:Mannitol dehydrogenase domain protein [Segniliparus rotundus DSM 44985]|uniref:Mannitol dehydrogenase domain protein n=2 Tax=Segniliparus rotundus TaxID=286802 RepID=D6ZDQ2_SEGRD|nr:Mannitol dehydrogenase domain protein [Segniliparus rotundus DSM 44985]